MYCLILLSVVAGVLGSVKQTGRCDPFISYFPVVDMRLFAGTTWYLIESLGYSWNGGYCPRNVLSRCSTDPVNILEKLDQFIINGTEYSIPRKVIRTKSNGGLMKVNPYTEKDTPLVKFYVLNTNVASYALLYNCVQNTRNTKTVTAYKVSRCKELSEEDAWLLDSITDEYEELKGCEWTTFDHRHCPF